MIYLFDDTAESFVREYINPFEYTDILCRYGSVSPTVLEAMTPSLEKAQCLLVHKSLKDAGDGTGNDVLRTLSSTISGFGKKVPLVLFSDGDLDTPVFFGATCIKAIKKTRFYSNLAAFLNGVRVGEKVNLSLIAYGDDISKLAVSTGQGLLSAITFKEGQEAVDPEDIDEETLESFVNMSLPAIGIDYDSLSADIEDGMVSVLQMRENVRNIMDSFVNYGENLHPWR